jgi:hypothetical protein
MGRKVDSGLCDLGRGQGQIRLENLPQMRESELGWSGRFSIPQHCTCGRKATHPPQGWLGPPIYRVHNN